MAKTLFAVDELSGLVTASVLVRLDRSVLNLEPKSVMKKMKDKAFTRGCNRDDIRRGAAEIEVELEQHIGNIIKALQASAGGGAGVKWYGECRDRREPLTPIFLGD